MNLVKQLQETAKRNYDNQLREANAALESVKDNLKMEGDWDNEMLKYFGTKDVIFEQSEKINQVNHFIKGEFITHDDIKDVCLSYNLRFLSTRFYKKEVPLSALNDLRKFKEERKITNFEMEENLKIIAPSNHFKLGERPKADPVLLYKDKDVYRVVSKWGSDFSNLRRVSGFFNSNPNILLFLGLVSLINIVCVSLVILYSIPKEWFFLNGIIIIYIIILTNDGDITPLEDKWESPYRN